MNIVRFAVVVLLIVPLLWSFDLIGAVLVTLLAMAVFKIMGAIRITRLIGGGVAEALPWGRLTAVTLRSLAAAVPAAWIVHSLSLRPILVVPIAAAAYGAVYAALSYGSLRAERPAGELPATLAVVVTEDV